MCARRVCVWVLATLLLLSPSLPAHTPPPSLAQHTGTGGGLALLHAGEEAGQGRVRTGVVGQAERASPWRCQGQPRGWAWGHAGVCGGGVWGCVGEQGRLWGRETRPTRRSHVSVSVPLTHTPSPPTHPHTHNTGGAEVRAPDEQGLHQRPALRVERVPVSVCCCCVH